MKTVFFDVDTQIDFMLPAGALYVPGAERVLPSVALLNRYAASRGFPVVSSMDAHTEDDPEFQSWPPHCVLGTLGQGKAAATLLDKRVVVPNRRCEIALDGAQQVLVQKQTLNVFDTCNIASLLERLAADEYVVYGVVTEYCVRFAALGLLKTGRPVTVATDAVKALGPADPALEEILAAGGRLATAAEICAR
jgi:nicotinamidase/pyrazinamidase